MIDRWGKGVFGCGVCVYWMKYNIIFVLGVFVWPRWRTCLGEVRVVRVVGPGWWVRLCD